jgi:riboflavin kinase / FMN adenylyltransferase
VNVLHSIADLAKLPGPICLAIGVFDGLHLGHRAVLEQAVQSAKAAEGTAVVVTFDPHPASVLRPMQAPALLTPTPHKLKLLAGLGVTHTLVQRFDQRFAGILPADFILQLTTACRPLKQICVGEDWSFGKGRSGDLKLLQLLGHTLRFEAVGVPAIVVKGEVVSSTAIRAALAAGELEHVQQLLGRPYSILGAVQAGRQLGRTIQFPTANISPRRYQLPPNGVYVVTVEHAGHIFGGIANLGVRPTIEANATERILEVHLFDFEGDLVGAELEVSLHHYLRPEQKFDSLEALKAQIAQDAATARTMFVHA